MNTLAPIALSVISMAALFRNVKKRRVLQQREEAALGAGAAGMGLEVAARHRNIQRMRDQTKAQLGLSMGVSPVLMGGGTYAEDPNVAAYIRQAASRGGY